MPQVTGPVIRTVHLELRVLQELSLGGCPLEVWPDRSKQRQDDPRIRAWTLPSMHS